jgi:hypothetical protein
LLCEENFEKRDGRVDVAEVFESFGFDGGTGFVDVFHVVPDIETHDFADFFLDVRIEPNQHLPQLQVLLQLFNQNQKTITHKKFLLSTNNPLVNNLKITGVAVHQRHGFGHTVTRFIFEYGKAHVVRLMLLELLEGGPEKYVVKTVDVRGADAQW